MEKIIMRKPQYFSCHKNKIYFIAWKGIFIDNILRIVIKQRAILFLYICAKSMLYNLLLLAES